MKEYHKIQSIYLRDPDNNHKTFLEGQYSRPEFEWLKDNDWVATEKVDGTNMRVLWDGESLEFRGKTDSAQLHTPLLRHMEENFEVDKFGDLFGASLVCFYGEGYGGKIQKAGATYGPEQRFVLFDIRINDVWLERDNVFDIAEGMGIPAVPVISIGPLDMLIELVKAGYESSWGEFPAEGFVCRPEVELLDRRGHRIITKIKCKDFPK